MTPIIRQHHAELVRLCEKYCVRRLEIFGSGATGKGFDPATSDLDFLVEYQPIEADGYADAYFGLREELQTLFQCPVDLVMERAIRNKYFRQGIMESRTTLYAA
uniref:Polymerase nucleotidyl transferase domain-containing protein n=1 Tax=Candidatus Kentrum sp. FM TaxID=2126340 RepID=A0A450TPG4_9GAMM|nr:MAG: hypothetical protein BECKFM1743C_GA0114222_105112 [Candidatus Kentron sp. FM]VFJ69851.1 MAG: hypothetical protein BECKFM1743A_GA0114220_105252 [Candidatus Kentron sp. FM]VFK17784.1 MAG: hypothetical protein BECKFM1743B_GA0114221_105022 [Candidatus Kentron sp. FM]